VAKDPEELDRIRRAAAATVAGFEEVYRIAEAGMTERDIEAELEVGFRRGGGDIPAYDSIVAAGPNAAVLHHEPTRTVVEPGQFVLIDAAAMVDGYACFISASRPTRCRSGGWRNRFASSRTMVRSTPSRVIATGRSHARRTLFPTSLMTFPTWIPSFRWSVPIRRASTICSKSCARAEWTFCRACVS
jgi:hypothetical protein